MSEGYAQKRSKFHPWFFKVTVLEVTWACKTSLRHSKEVTLKKLVINHLIQNFLYVMASNLIAMAST